MNKSSFFIIGQHAVVEALKNTKDVINMEELLKILYNTCKDKDIVIKMDDEADIEYDDFHDEGVDFRRENKENKNEKSIVSKARTMTVRVSGIIALLRSSLENLQENQVSR